MTYQTGESLVGYLYLNIFVSAIWEFSKKWTKLFAIVTATLTSRVVNNASER